MMARCTYLIVLVVLGLSTLEAQSDVTASGCGERKTCVYFPEGCSLAEDGCRFASWAKSDTADSIDIEIRAGEAEQLSVNYVAFAFGTMNQMQDADVYYCGGNKLRTAVIRARHDQPVESPLENGMVNINVSVVDGKPQCKFTRPFSVTKMISANADHVFDVTKNSYFILMAEGSMTDEEMTYHEWKAVSSVKVDFTQNFASEVVTTTPATTEAPTTMPTTMSQVTKVNETVAMGNITEQTAMTRVVTPTKPSQAATSQEMTTSSSYPLKAPLWLLATIYIFISRL